MFLANVKNARLLKILWYKRNGWKSIRVTKKAIVNCILVLDVLYISFA